MVSNALQSCRIDKNGMRNSVSVLMAWLCVGMWTALNAQVMEGPAAEKFLHGCEMVRYTERTPLPNYVKMRSGMEVDAANIPSLLRKVYQLGENGNLKPVGNTDDALGFQHLKYQQTLGDIEVEGAELNLHLLGGKLHSFNGDIFPMRSLATSPTVTVHQALQAAITKMGAVRYRWEDEGENRFLRFETGDPMATWYPTGSLVYAPLEGDFERGEFALAWKFDIYAMEPLMREWVYVDARTGEVIWRRNRIHTADAVGTAVTRYSGTQTMTADQVSSNSFRLRETGRGGGIQTFNMARTTNYSNTDFTDTDNNWNNVNANQDEVATDAHWGAEKTYDFYWLTFNRNSIDGAGLMLKSYVHYDVNYNNAFWDGQRMTYGDGNGSLFTPLTAIDVTGHEITHGLTEHTANLVYSGESGALNESFSDIFGNCIEHYSRPTDWSWRIGEDMTPNGNGIRSMQNPGIFSDPDTYGGTYWAPGNDVHVNSGVQNKWFYILTIGESGTNDIGSTYNVTGQGWAKSQAITFRSLTVYLSPASTYTDARFYAIRAAIDLYGACTPEVIATTNAWYAVGVGPAFTNTVTSNFTATPTSMCSAPATVQFTNASVNAGTFLWNFGDGGTSTAVSPQHTYNSVGTYTVSLFADAGSCGTDTYVRNNYIVLDTNLACNVTLSPTNLNSTQTACSGTLFDTGGPSANYGDNIESIITIAPTGASQVTLHWLSFDMETNYDYLYVYDGPSTNSPLIGTYTGQAIPADLTSTGGAITLRQSTDPAVEGTGFEIHWTCLLPNAAPVVDFSADNLTSCNGVVNFRDLSTMGPNTWAWNFGDGFTSTQQHPSHTYLTNGNYTVSLTASNNIGSGSLTRTAYITVNRPAGPSANGVTRCGPGSVTLNATGSGTINWYAQATGGAVIGNGASYTTPVLSNSVVYYVEAQTPALSQFVGPANPAAVSASGGYHNNTSTQYLNFTVSTTMVFVSCYVDPGAAGARTISLWDGAGTLIRDTLITISANPGRITLNWTITPGQYRIGGTSMDLYRNNAGAAFPYSIANFVSITGSSAGSAFYYYFYDWEVRGLDCLSERTPVPVTIEAFPTADFSSSTNGLTTTFTDLSVGATTWAWNFGDGGNASIQNPSHTYAGSGTYTVTLIITTPSGCADTITHDVQITVVGIDPSWAALWENLQVTPNPFSNQLGVRMDLPMEGDLNIAMYDLQGRKVLQIWDGKASQGEFKHKTTDLLNRIACGTYILRVEFGSEMRAVRVVKME